jgi:hypothetical protein
MQMDGTELGRQADIGFKLSQVQPAWPAQPAQSSSLSTTNTTQLPLLLLLLLLSTSSLFSTASIIIIHIPRIVDSDNKQLCIINDSCRHWTSQSVFGVNFARTPTTVLSLPHLSSLSTDTIDHHQPTNNQVN